MTGQVDHYEAFARDYGADILQSADPAVWATDMAQNGPNHRCMKRRVEMQAKLMEQFFHPGEEVLDLGCGFGRQALVIARRGFPVLGLDSSPAFVGLAERLFAKEGLRGQFRTASILEADIQPRHRNLMLLDVLEHLPPALRPALVQRLRAYGSTGARCLISLPWRSSLREFPDNLRRWLGISKDEEHPYVLPSPRAIRRLFRKGFRELHQCLDRPHLFFVFEITEEAPA